MLIDRAKIFLAAGHGGDGCVSFRREKFVPRGGPDGGDGGRGGHIILRTEANLHTLSDFTYHTRYAATAGKGGEGGNRHGADGGDVLLKVPVGTEVIDGETGEVLADLSRQGMEILVARGGKGGRGNNHFKSSTNRAPRQREWGEPGEARWLILELKLLADVGLLGFPNAGKSTLLSRISEARPKVASYPFTTLEPGLGVWDLPGGRTIVADVPGIISGAHRGKGLGLRFLKHLERTRVLLYLIDFAADHPPLPPWEQFAALRAEVEAYNKGLESRPYLVSATKMDLAAAERNWESHKGLFHERGIHPLPISALSGRGLAELAEAVDALLLREGRKLDASIR